MGKGRWVVSHWRNLWLLTSDEGKSWNKRWFRKMYFAFSFLVWHWLILDMYVGVHLLLICNLLLYLWFAGASIGRDRWLRMHVCRLPLIVLSPFHWERIRRRWLCTWAFHIWYVAHLNLNWISSSRLASGDLWSLLLSVVVVLSFIIGLLDNRVPIQSIVAAFWVDCLALAGVHKIVILAGEFLQFTLPLFWRASSNVILPF